jgi:ATP-binding cassette subfamily B protein
MLQAFGGKLSIGDVVLYTSAVANVQTALVGLVGVLSNINESVLFYGRYTNLLALPQPLRTSSSVQAVPPLKSGIELRNVSFRYSDYQPWVLRNLDMFIPAGQCVALVGLNGAGKTTLVKLLTRMYDPTEGQILWDGIELSMFDPSDLREHIAAILQDFTRYHLTAKENIGLGEIKNSEDMASIHRSAMAAGIHSTIESLPAGYATILSKWLAEDGQGVDLSGGEWQKMALARMFLRQADMLILDEPTAALDAQAEYDIYGHFVDLMAGRTSLLISHRFSTVRMADVIVTLKNGRITEYGSHDKLMALGGTYAKLYNMQAEKYR